MLEKLDKSQKNRSLLDLVCNDQEFKRVKVLISQQLLDLSCELSKERDALQEVYHDFCQETEQNICAAVWKRDDLGNLAQRQRIQDLLNSIRQSIDPFPENSNVYLASRSLVSFSTQPENIAKWESMLYLENEEKRARITYLESSFDTERIVRDRMEEMGFSFDMDPNTLKHCLDKAQLDMKITLLPKVDLAKIEAIDKLDTNEIIPSDAVNTEIQDLLLELENLDLPLSMPNTAAPSPIGPLITRAISSAPIYPTSPPKKTIRMNKKSPRKVKITETQSLSKPPPPLGKFLKPIEPSTRKISGIKSTRRFLAVPRAVT